MPDRSESGTVRCDGRWRDEGFLTTEEVLDYLQVNLRTVYRLIKAGKIPAVRVGRQWRFRSATSTPGSRASGRGKRRERPLAPARIAGRPAGRPRVLVVDDEASVRDLLSKTLALAEYDVDLAPTAAPRSSGCACSPTTS